MNDLVAAAVARVVAGLLKCNVLWDEGSRGPVEQLKVSMTVYFSSQSARMRLG